MSYLDYNDKEICLQKTYTDNDLYRPQYILIEKDKFWNLNKEKNKEFESILLSNNIKFSQFKQIKKVVDLLHTEYYYGHEYHDPSFDVVDFIKKNSILG